MLQLKGKAGLVAVFRDMRHVATLDKWLRLLAVERHRSCFRFLFHSFTFFDVA